MKFIFFIFVSSSVCMHIPLNISTCLSSTSELIQLFLS
jgi:hypothetical protein